MELHCIPVDTDADQYILYRPLVGVAFVGNRSMAKVAMAVGEPGWPLIADQAAGGAVAFLERIGFLADDPLPPPPVSREFRPTTAVLLMTNQCQLRCVYCYAAAGKPMREELSPALGRAAIETVCDNAIALGVPHFDVSFHGGGEPTLAWRVMRECAAHARSLPIPAKLSLTSNGIWSESQLEWVLETIDGLTLSFDGLPWVQDRHRPFATGEGSSRHVMRSLAALDRRGFPYAIRMTATPPSREFVEGVRFICAETACRTIQVEPAFNEVRGGHCEPEVEDCVAFAEAFLEALDVARAARCSLFYSAARIGGRTSTFCTAPYNALIVTPQGEQVSCYEVTDRDHPLAALSTIGRYMDGTFQVDDFARGRLHELLDERQAGCVDCFCRRSCAGDCYTRTWGAEPGGHQQRGARCSMNREITRGMLLRAIADGGGVWRRDAGANGECPGLPGHRAGADDARH